MKLITFISAGFFLVFAGSLLKKEPAAEQMPLYGTKWALKKMQSESGLEQVSTKAFIKFDAEKKSAGGNGSCNSFGSNVAVHDKEITFSNIFSTKMYCDDVQKIEDRLFSALGEVDRFEIDGTKLSLFRDNELLLEFESVQDIPAS